MPPRRRLHLGQRPRPRPGRAQRSPKPGRLPARRPRRLRGRVPGEHAGAAIRRRDRGGVGNRTLRQRPRRRPGRRGHRPGADRDRRRDPGQRRARRSGWRPCRRRGCNAAPSTSRSATRIPSTSPSPDYRTPRKNAPRNTTIISTPHRGAGRRSAQVSRPTPPGRPGQPERLAVVEAGVDRGGGLGPGSHGHGEQPRAVLEGYALSRRGVAQQGRPHYSPWHTSSSAADRYFGLFGTANVIPPAPQKATMAAIVPRPGSAGSSASRRPRAPPLPPRPDRRERRGRAPARSSSLRAVVARLPRRMGRTVPRCVRAAARAGGLAIALALGGCGMGEEARTPPQVRSRPGAGGQVGDQARRRR
jgi:hypothetical protein